MNTPLPPSRKVGAGITSPTTAIIHHRTSCDDARPTVTPLFQSSAFNQGSPFFYTRKDNPNVAEFEECLGILEHADHAVAFATGMAALKACLELARHGSTIVLHSLVYGCTARLLDRVCSARGIALVVADIASEAFDFAALDDVGIVLFETPTNPFLRSVPIDRVARAVKAVHPDALVIVDNTWATPLFQKPLQHGADISVHSGTKYLSGHSDVMGGVVLTNSPGIANHLRDERFYSGAVLDPFAAWLLRRSLHTLGVRVARQSKTTKHLAQVLGQLSSIERVYFPEIDGDQLTGYAGIVFLQLGPDSPVDYQALAERLEFFGTGTGMACVSSMIAQPYNGSHASMTREEKAGIGLDEGLVRLCFGLEEPGDLEADLLSAFSPQSEGHR